MKKRSLPAASEYASIDPSITIVNVVLLLIFFFIATGSLLNSSTDFEGTPKTTELPLDLLPEPILVLEPGGGMQLNGEPVPVGSLRTSLNPADKRLHVLVDSQQPARQILAIIERENVTLVDVLLVTIRRDPNVPSGPGGASP